MKEAEKEKIIFELRLKEIEAIDRDHTSQDIRFIGGILAGLVLVYYALANLLPKYKILFFFILVGFGVILYSSGIYSSKQNIKYIEDCYSNLHKCIKENSLLNYKLIKNNRNFLGYYKKRYI